jgi:hypothetical protein
MWPEGPGVRLLGRRGGTRVVADSRSASTGCLTRGSQDRGATWPLARRLVMRISAYSCARFQRTQFGMTAPVSWDAHSPGDTQNFPICAVARSNPKLVPGPSITAALRAPAIRLPITLRDRLGRAADPSNRSRWTARTRCQRLPPGALEHQDATDLKAADPGVARARRERILQPVAQMLRHLILRDQPMGHRTNHWFVSLLPAQAWDASDLQSVPSHHTRQLRVCATG